MWSMGMKVDTIQWNHFNKKFKEDNDSDVIWYDNKYQHSIKK